jgi:maltooligosyltrehalose trehalohydrolase
MVERARAAAAPRSIIMVGENEPQHTEMLAASGVEGSLGFDALWNDDFHHSARVALTGRRDGYFHDHSGRAQEFVSAIKYGFLFQGQRYCWQKKSRGSPALECPASSFIVYTQNHDQVANTFYGLRLHELTSPGRLRAMTALLLLAPQTPLLFMGQELNASTPFAYFADHKPELAPAVWKGRKNFMRQFVHYATPAAQERLLDPASIETFTGSKLDFSERTRHRAVLDLHRDLLRLRREDAVIAQQDSARIDGAVLAERAFLLRWFDSRHGDRLMLLNFGEALELRHVPEPLLAAPRNARWEVVWCSDEPAYGGPGSIEPWDAHGCWRVAAECAVFLRSQTQ